MRRDSSPSLPAAAALLAALLVLASPVPGLAVTSAGRVSAADTGAAAPAPLPDSARRRMAHGMALAGMGRSGLRALLSTSGNLGDLQNRAGSYRMAVQMERARTGPLRGRIAALDEALADPYLPPEERTVLTELRQAATSELAAVPRYEMTYRALTTQAEALVPFGFLGERPLFLLVRGRAHARWGGEDGLTVFSEAASLGPVLVASGRWIVTPGLTVGRTDVEIAPFDGSSGATFVGPRLDVGGILGDGWSAALQVTHVWSRGETSVMRPARDGAVAVRTEGWSATTSAKAEVKGRFRLSGPGETTLSIQPRLGAYVLSSHSPPVTNSLGETGTGPFGTRETAAAARVGASVGTSVGAWTPSLYLGYERELTDEMSAMVRDPDAVLGAAGVSWSWSRGRRVVLDYSLVRGLDGLRRVSELTVVLILDG